MPVNFGVIYCEATLDNTAAEGEVQSAKTLSEQENAA